MTTTPDDPTTALPRRPPVADLATWQAARDELLVREKAHTRDGETSSRPRPQSRIVISTCAPSGTPVSWTAIPPRSRMPR